MVYTHKLFFFQEEDGIRDLTVTGVQTCAFFFSSRRRHTRFDCDWSSDVCSSDLAAPVRAGRGALAGRPDRDRRHVQREPGLAALGPRLKTALRGNEIEIGRASCRERV